MDERIARIPSPPVNSGRQRWPTRFPGTPRTWAAAVLAVYFLLGIWFSLAVPPFETPDEIYHYAFARHLAQGNGLPVQAAEPTGPWEQEGSQAPLYYLIVGRLTAGIDQQDWGDLNVVNPRANIGDPLYPGNKNVMLYSAAPRPLQGVNLALHVGRWFSLLLGGITLWLIYRTACLAFSESSWLPVAAMALVASIPQFIFISASFSNDSLIVATSTAVLYWLARLLQRDDARPIRLWEWAVLGILLGLAALSKLQGVGLLGLAAVTVLGLAWWRRDARLVWQAAAPVALPVLLIAGWWYWRNYVLYGDWTGVRYLIAINGLRTEPLSWVDFWDEFRGLRYSFWGLFGWFNILFPSWIYRVLDGVTLLAVAGWLLGGVPTPGRTGRRIVGLLALWLALVWALWLAWTWRATGSQGRLLFPALSAMGILGGMGLAGWRRLLPARSHGPLLAALPLFLLACSLYAVSVLVPSSYRAPGPVAQVPPSAQPVGIVYGREDRFELLALELPQRRYRPGDGVPVTLYLRALTRPRADYQLFVQLLDETGKEVGNLTSHPGWGRNPTSLWEPGAIYVDRYRVPISRPIDPWAPLLARVYVGFVDPATEERGRLPVPAYNAGGEEIVPFVASVVIEPAVQPELSDYGLEPVGSRFGHVIELAGASLPEAVSLSATDVFTVTLLWEAIGTPPADYTGFVHLLDADGNRVAGFDRAPAGDRFPTRYWQAGDRIVSHFVVPLPADLPPGRYQAWVGLYDAASQGAARLPVTEAAGREVAHELVLLGTVTVR